MSVDVVLPVRNALPLLGDCLESILPQVRALNGRLFVFDDASSDGSGDLAERHGATVLRAVTPNGPYHARNAAWRAGTSPLVAFTDVRCRADAGWLVELVDAMGDNDVAIAGGDVRVGPGSGLAHRFAAQRNLLSAQDFLRDEYLPYLPTANLITRRSVLEGLGGFVEVRSGGDVELCWRAQLAGLGRVAYATGATMWSVPRDSTSDVLRQWTRYGRSRVETVGRFADAGFVVKPPPTRSSIARIAGATLARRVVASRGRDIDVHVVDRLAFLAYWRSYRRAHAELLAKTEAN